MGIHFGAVATATLERWIALDIPEFSKAELKAELSRRNGVKKG